MLYQNIPFVENPIRHTKFTQIIDDEPNAIAAELQTEPTDPKWDERRWTSKCNKIQPPIINSTVTNQSHTQNAHPNGKIGGSNTSGI